MFGNLKNKLGEAADLKKYAAPQSIVNSLMGSRQRSGTHTPSVPASPMVSMKSSASTGHSANQHSSGSVTPLPSFSHSPLSPASSRTHSRQASITSPPLSPGLSPTPAEESNGSSNSPQKQVCILVLFLVL